MRHLAVAMLSLTLFASRIFAQGSNASLTGFIQDSSKAFISGVHVLAVNTNTNQQFQATTNKDGSYSIASLPVGPYRMQIEKNGFQTIVKEGLFLHTQDVLQINFDMVVGSTSQTVTVSSQGADINTTDAAVGTVIDRKFVEGIPMNGRSFETLVLLSPGTVTNTPQVGAGTPPGNDQGEYSVNGMRSDANNFTVDGASASNAPSVASAAGSAGMLSSATMLGTTQAMLPLDAMEEFRISTSTYSAEYGRQPGAQISFRSRSGANDYHGTAYDYLRNSDLDANNWFNTYSNPPFPTPAVRQNDFGGTLGGPLSAPHLYSGKDRAFFFFAYEGLRLVNPLPATIIDVPSNGTYNTGTYANALYKNLRANAPAALRPVLNAFPKPNCSAAQDPQCVDYGVGGSPYIYTPVSRGATDSVFARVDYQLLPSMRIFARYQDTTSNNTTAGPNIASLVGRNRVYLLASDNTFGGTISNELRLQYSLALYKTSDATSSAGGAAPINLWTAQGLPSGAGENEVFVELPNEVGMIQQNYGSKQTQPNGAETLTWIHGKHLLKFGADYRQTTAYYGDGALSRGPYGGYTYTSAATILDNQATIKAVNYLRIDPTTKNLGLFAQDEWRLLPGLSLSLGLRWELSPPPSVSGAPMYTYTGDVNNPSSLGLSAPNAPLYKTTYTDFAPRLGVAWSIRHQPGYELVFRAGGGMFYDLIALNEAFGNGDGLGSATTTSLTKTAFPLTSSQILVPVTVPPKPPYNFQQYPNNQMVPPSSIQWNTSLEQGLGKNQSVTVGYVASLGRQLPIYKEYRLSSANPEFSDVYLYINGPGSNYNSLQMKYQRQMSHGLQAVASYTWSHAIDWASTEDNYNISTFPVQRGNSNFDVRHNFTAALVYTLPTNYANRLEKAILGNWSADLWFVTRTAFPYEPVGPAIVNAITGGVSYEELNYNGQSPYVYKAGIPGGRQINPAIFTVPLASANGIGDAPRNFLRGFGEIQANVAIQRNFPLAERVQLQFRAEAFNLANHPNFGTVNTTCGVTTAGAKCNNPLMGQATNTLSAGLGGLSALYQQGGPRSLQFMLKLQF